MSAPYRIERREDIPLTIAFLHSLGGAPELRIPVLQALYDGRIAALDIGARTSAKDVKLFLASAKKPTLAILGDDVDEPAGPAGMPCVERLLRWARTVIVHGSGGQIADYIAAVAAAERYGRVLLVECRSEAIEAWHEAACRWAPKANGLIIRPPAGAQHPDPESAGL